MGKRYYDNYDYEEAYKEQCKKLEEAEMERWMKEGWVNCLYRTSTYKSTNTESNTTLLESMVYPSFKFKADMPKTAVAIKILEGDATIAFITVPLGLSMLLSKEMLIINKYYWKCEEKAERGVQ